MTVDSHSIVIVLCRSWQTFAQLITSRLHVSHRWN